MAQEIREEDRWFGGKENVIYEDGTRVGVTRHETTIFGNPVDRTYNNSGERVSETRHETTIFGTSKEVTRDTNGNRISETRYREGIFGGNKGVIHQDGNRIGVLETKNGILGGRRQVLNSSSGDVDLTRRAVIEKSTQVLGAYSGGGGSGDYGSSISDENISEASDAEPFLLGVALLVILVSVFVWVIVLAVINALQYAYMAAQDALSGLSWGEVFVRVLVIEIVFTAIVATLHFLFFHDRHQPVLGLGDCSYTINRQSRKIELKIASILNRRTGRSGSIKVVVYVSDQRQNGDSHDVGNLYLITEYQLQPLDVNMQYNNICFGASLHTWVTPVMYVSIFLTEFNKIEPHNGQYWRISSTDFQEPIIC